MMISRRALLAGGVSALACPAVARDAPFRIFQITYRGLTGVERGFVDYLNQRRVNVEITHVSAALDPSRVPGIVVEAKARAPDLMYTWGTPVTLGTYGKIGEIDPERNITDIPGVFTMVSTPVRAGVVPNRASSGRNITGTSHVVPTEPQLRAMRSYLPFDKLGILYTPTEQNSAAIVAGTRELAEAVGFTLVERTFPLDEDGKPSASSADQLVGEIAEEGAEWLYYLPDTFLSQNIAAVAAAATARGLPGFSAVERNQGYALVSLVSRYPSLGQLTAYKAEQILLGGVEPADIPIETLKRFALVVNMPLANRLKLYPPLGMLSYANVLTE